VGNAVRISAEMAVHPVKPAVVGQVDPAVIDEILFLQYRFPVAENIQRPGQYPEKQNFENQKYYYRGIHQISANRSPDITVFFVVGPENAFQ